MKIGATALIGNKARYNLIPIVNEADLKHIRRIDNIVQSPETKYHLKDSKMIEKQYPTHLAGTQLSKFSSLSK